MIKILLKFFIVLFFINSAVFAEVINKVEVKGNKRISKETIIVLGDIQLNQDFNEIKLNDTLKKLYHKQNF